MRAAVAVGEEFSATRCRLHSIAMTKMVTITIALNSDVFALLCNYKLVYISNNQHLLGEAYTLDAAIKKSPGTFQFSI